MNIIRDALPLSLANAVAAQFPGPDWPYWHRYNTETSVKFGSMDCLRFPKSCELALQSLSNRLAEHVSSLWPNGFIDTEWHAGGLHLIPPGGFLGRHLDAEYHPIKPWRRLGSIVWFANRDWIDEWGGELVIRDQVIRPQFNTAVMFECDSEAWHEVRKVTGPHGRRTLAMFVWSAENNTVRHTDSNACTARTSAHFA